MSALHLLAAALAQAAPAPRAAERPPQPNDPIVVIGQSPEEIKRQANQYVRELNVATTQRQAARWFDPVCPRAAGIDGAYAAMVEKQIRDLARSVGAPLAAPGCKANFAIIFTDDAPALLKKIDGVRLREVPPSSLGRLRRGTDPVRWWYTTKPITRSQIPTDATTSITSESKSKLSGGGGNSAGGLPSNNQTSYTHEDRFSRLSTQTMRSLESATVIIQADERPLSALAAYAAFVGLAEIDPGASPTGSILSLFENSVPLRELTESDRAFLLALYRMRMDQRGEQQRRELVEEIVQAKVPKG